MSNKNNFFITLENDEVYIRQGKDLVIKGEKGSVHYKYFQKLKEIMRQRDLERIEKNREKILTRLKEDWGIIPRDEVEFTYKGYEIKLSKASPIYTLSASCEDTKKEKEENKKDYFSLAVEHKLMTQDDVDYLINILRIPTNQARERLILLHKKLNLPFFLWKNFYSEKQCYDRCTYTYSTPDIHFFEYYLLNKSLERGVILYDDFLTYFSNWDYPTTPIRFCLLLLRKYRRGYKKRFALGTIFRRTLELSCVLDNQELIAELLKFCPDNSCLFNTYDYSIWHYKDLLSALNRENYKNSLKAVLDYLCSDLKKE